MSQLTDEEVFERLLAAMVVIGFEPAATTPSNTAIEAARRMLVLLLHSLALAIGESENEFEDRMAQRLDNLLKDKHSELHRRLSNALRGWQD